MTRDELEKRNVGENLDALMNLDPATVSAAFCMQAAAPSLASR